MCRAASYIRTNDDPAGVQAQRQRVECAGYVAEHGWRLVATFEDLDGRRPLTGFDGLVDAVRAGRIDIVVARDGDRLARRTEDLDRLLAALEEAGAELHTATSKDLDVSGATSASAWALARAKAKAKS